MVVKQELKTINYVSRSSKLFLSIESDFSVQKRGFSARVSKVVKSFDREKLFYVKIIKNAGLSGTFSHQLHLSLPAERENIVQMFVISH